jgi:two-component system, NarL family, invasion response regulator UvrY
VLQNGVGPMISVLVIDDHDVVRQGLTRIISAAEGLSVKGEASTAAQAMKLFKEDDFDVVLLDISLPDLNGLSLLDEMRILRPGQQVLVLTMHPEKQYAIRALRQGAAGYLTKDSASEELLEALLRVASGQRYITPGVAEQLTKEALGERDRPPHLTLSKREFSVMLEVASGLSLKEIAALLDVSDKTVSTYRTRLLEKMGMTNNAELVRYAVENHLVE